MPWDDIARCQHNCDHLRYPSDLTDREWLIIEPFIPPAKPGGRLRTTRGGPDRLDKLAALLRCIPVADQAAKIPLEKVWCCCWACGDVGKASALSIISSRPVSYASAGVRPSRAECGRSAL